MCFNCVFDLHNKRSFTPIFITPLVSLLGLAACRELPSYQGWLGDVNRLPRRAWGRGRRAAASHVRQSLRGKRSKAEAKAQVAGLAAAADLRVELRLAISGSCQVWHLVQPDSTVGALLVTRSGEPEPRKVSRFEGEAGAEHTWYATRHPVAP